MIVRQLKIKAKYTDRLLQPDIVDLRLEVLGGEPFPMMLRVPGAVAEVPQTLKSNLLEFRLEDNVDYIFELLIDVPGTD